MNSKTGIEIHADDYAISPSSYKDILALCKAGRLDGISVIPNMAIGSEAAAAFNESKGAFLHTVHVTVHINFMEGKSVSPREEVPDLVDKDGYFTVSWGRLILWNYNPFMRSRIRKELQKEITAQANRCIALGIADKEHLRIDSHQHPHAIPIVADALADAIKKEDWTVTYIRIPRDPIRLYLPQVRFYRTFSPVNILKCLILNHYSTRLERMVRKLLSMKLSNAESGEGRQQSESAASVSEGRSPSAAPKGRCIEGRSPSAAKDAATCCRSEATCIEGWSPSAAKRCIEGLNILCGVFYSGHMDRERVLSVLPAFKKYCSKKGCTAEILFHPGLVLPEELNAEFVKSGANVFHTSANRHIERDCVLTMQRE